jgi:hypothetical protein
MVLEMVSILEEKPVRRARRTEIGEWLPCKKVLKMLLVPVSGESGRVREAPWSNILAARPISL